MMNINDKNERVFDLSVELKDNALLKARPDLFNEWDFTKNDDLGLDIYKVAKKSNKIAWWNCPKCKSSYDIIIANREKGQNCSYCSGKRVNETNSLMSLKPEIAKEWHLTLNESITSHNVSYKSGKDAWWQCPRHKEHVWKARIASRADGAGCPYCSKSSPATLKGFNDMWVTNPKLASLLADPEDGHKYTQSSGKKVDWKCPSCYEAIKQKEISKIYIYGLSCPICNDGFRLPEKIMYQLLKQLNIKFESQKTFAWSSSKRYDFYFKYNDVTFILETHGGQHYGNGFDTCGGRTLEEEVENDQIKHELAIKNGIENYIVVDARDTSPNAYKEKIIVSGLGEIFNLTNVNWEDIYIKSSKSILFEVCEAWNNGERSTPKIAKDCRIAKVTVIRYLKRGAEIGLCDYTVNHQNRKVVQLTLSNEYMATWNSIVEARDSNLLKDHGNITSSCNGKRKSAYGFKWMYKEDYDSAIVK